MDSSPVVDRRYGRYQPVPAVSYPVKPSGPQREWKPPPPPVPQQIHPSDYSSVEDDATVMSVTAIRNRRIMVAKYCIYGFNLVILIVGVLLMTTGAWVRTDSHFREFLSERYRNVVQEVFWQAPTLYIFSYILIVLGACMIVVPFFGCCGTIRESGYILIFYFCCVFLLFVATLSSGLYLVFKKDSIENELSDALDYMVQHYYQGAGIIQEALDRLQTTFRCCGNAGCVDFRDYRKDVPRSCDIRCDGCRYRMWEALRIGATVTSILMFFVIIAELLAMAMSLYLFCARRSPMEQYIVHTYYRNPAYIKSQQRMPLPEQKLSEAEYNRRVRDQEMQPMRKLSEAEYNRRVRDQEMQPMQKLSEAEYNRRVRDQEMQPMQMRRAPQPVQDEHFYAEYDVVEAQQPPMQKQMQRPLDRQPYSRSAPPPYHFDPRR